jgi:hypothetical protein
MSKDSSQIYMMQRHFESFLVVPVSTCIDDLAMAETARFEPSEISDRQSCAVPEVLDLTGEEAPSELEQKNWSHTPQQRLNRLKYEYPQGNEATLRRRLRRSLQVKPVKTFYSSHVQTSLHLSQIDQSHPNWDIDLVSDDQSSSSTDHCENTTIDLTQGPTATPKTNFDFRGPLLHPLSAAGHPSSFSSVESKRSCISDAAWFPVLDAVARFFSDTTTVSSGITPGFSALMEMEEHGMPNIGSRRPTRQSPFCIESGLNDEWIDQLKDLWSVYPSQMLLFIEKQMVMALREVRTKLLNAASPPPPWTFWRRPDTPLCGLATPNDFNPESPDSWKTEYGEDGEVNEDISSPTLGDVVGSELKEDILSPTLVSELAMRQSKYVVPAQGVSLGPMDALSLAVLHRVMNYWEVMKVKIKPLAQIIDSLMNESSKNEYFSSLLWMDSRSRSSDPSKPISPSVSYYSYNPFSLPQQEIELGFERIFMLLFRTVILRHYSIRACLRRACFIYRQLFSLDSPQELADMIRIRNLETDIRFMDQNAWHWKFRLSVHHYITSSRVSHDISQYPIIYSPLVMSLLAPLKDSPRQRQGDTLSSRWPILTTNHLQHMTRYFPNHRFGPRDRIIPGFTPLSQLEFPISMPIEWSLLKGEAMAHPRLMDVIQRARRRHTPLYDLTQIEDSNAAQAATSRAESTTKQSIESNEQATGAGAIEPSVDDQFSALFKVPDAVAGYVTPTVLTTILQARLDELDEEWSDDSDADYPEDDDDPHDWSTEDGGASEDSALTEHSEYEYYDSEEEGGQMNEEDEAAAKTWSFDFLEGDRNELGHQEGFYKSRGAHSKTMGSSGAGVAAKSSSSSSKAVPDFPNFELPSLGPATIDWSVLDAALVETVMEAKSRDEIARLIALRLGISGGNLPYEIADLIPSAFLQKLENDGTGSKRSNKAKKLSSAVSASSAYSAASKRSATSSHDEEAKLRAAASTTAARPSKMTKRSELDIAPLPPIHGDSSRDEELLAQGNKHPGSYQSPFGPEAANGLALPVPSAAPPPHPHSRRAMLLARTLTQPFDSDDDPEADEEEIPTEVIFNPHLPANHSSPTYPYSVAARLHNLRMNDPYEGSTMYKLGTTPNLDEAPQETPQTRAKRAQVHSVKAQAMMERRAAAAAVKNQKSISAHSTPSDPRVPGIADTSKSVDELLEFIEGPSTKSKATKKKNAKEEKTATPLPAAPKVAPNASAASNTSQDTGTNGTKQKSTANQSMTTSSALPRSDAPPSAANSAKSAQQTKSKDTTAHVTQPKTDAKTSAARATSAPLSGADYPEFWSSDDLPLNSEQRKALDDEITNFQKMLEQTFAGPLAPRLPFSTTNEPVSNAKKASKKPGQAITAQHAGSIQKATPPVPAPFKTDAPTSFKLDSTMFASIASKARSDSRNVFQRSYPRPTVIPQTTTNAPAPALATAPGKAKQTSTKKRK